MSERLITDILYYMHITMTLNLQKVKIISTIMQCPVEFIPSQLITVKQMVQ